jgi:hypothetical protein
LHNYTTKIDTNYRRINKPIITVIHFMPTLSVIYEPELVKYKDLGTVVRKYSYEVVAILELQNMHSFQAYTKHFQNLTICSAAHQVLNKSLMFKSIHIIF